jgi:predicted DNA-binding protein (UPF0251 family)
MTEKLTAFIYNGATGEQESRELSAAEISELEALRVSHLETKAAEEARFATRKSALAKLAALGLTQEEIEAL